MLLTEGLLKITPNMRLVIRPLYTKYTRDSLRQTEDQQWLLLKSHSWDWKWPTHNPKGQTLSFWGLLFNLMCNNCNWVFISYVMVSFVLDLEHDFWYIHSMQNLSKKKNVLFMVNCSVNLIFQSYTMTHTVLEMSLSYYLLQIKQGMRIEL